MFVVIKGLVVFHLDVSLRICTSGFCFPRATACQCSLFFAAPRMDQNSWSTWRGHSSNLFQVHSLTEGTFLIWLELSPLHGLLIQTWQFWAEWHRHIYFWFSSNLHRGRRNWTSCHLLVYGGRRNQFASYKIFHFWTAYILKTTPEKRKWPAVEEHDSSLPKIRNRGKVGQLTVTNWWNTLRQRKPKYTLPLWAQTIIWVFHHHVRTINFCRKILGRNIWRQK